MKNTSAFLLGLLVGAAAAWLLRPDDEDDPILDRVITSQPATSPWAALVTGKNATGDLHFDGAAVTGSLMIPNVSPREGANELVAFSRMGPPVRLVDCWTDGLDVHSVCFPPACQVDIAVWICAGDPALQEARIRSDLVLTDILWQEEGLGLRIGHVTFADVSAAAPAVLAVSSCNSATRDLLWALGHEDDKINIYVVDDVSELFEADPVGVKCGSDSVVIQKHTVEVGGLSPTVLAHEMLHLMGLTHVTAGARFDATNLMYEIAHKHEFLTEGQIYRAHYQEGSVVRDLCSGVDSGPTTNCITDPEHCPELWKRTWSDGDAWPPN